MTVPHQPQPPHPQEPNLLWRLRAHLAAVAGAGAAAAWIWVRGVDTLGLRCPVAALTGLDCPGCGATRALAALLDGDIAGAVDHNVAVPVAAVILAWVWAATLTATIGDRTVTHPLRWRRSALVVAVAVGVFTVARNVDPVAGWLAAGTS